jgi:hypothetical protein
MYRVRIWNRLDGKIVGQTAANPKRPIVTMAHARRTAMEMCRAAKMRKDFPSADLLMVDILKTETRIVSSQRVR